MRPRGSCSCHLDRLLYYILNILNFMLNLIYRQDLEVTRRRLMILEDKLAKNTRALEVEQKCQNLHQSFLPSLDTIVVLASKPRVCVAMGQSSSY